MILDKSHQNLPGVRATAGAPGRSRDTSAGATRDAKTCVSATTLLLNFFLLLSSLELSDKKVYAPYIGARLGTAAHLCEVVVLKLRTFAR